MEVGLKLKLKGWELHFFYYIFLQCCLRIGDASALFLAYLISVSEKRIREYLSERWARGRALLIISLLPLPQLMQVFQPIVKDDFFSFVSCLHYDHGQDMDDRQLHLSQLLAQNRYANLTLHCGLWCYAQVYLKIDKISFS